MDNERITEETPEVLLNHGYQYTSLIGEGSNGKTYRAKNLKTGEIVAIKAIKFSQDLKNYELFKREAETLKTIHTAGVPKFYDYITNETSFTECWLVQEHIKGQSIFDKIELKARQGYRYTESETLNLLRECALIIYSLQTDYMPPIIHRDIKPSNILVNFKGDRVYLIDFGAVTNPTRRSTSTTVAGTVGYMAPEQLLGESVIQSDYFSLGATALHMLTGVHPSEFPTDNFQIEFDGLLYEYCPKLSANTHVLLHKLLEPHASDRPSNAHELLELINACITPSEAAKSHKPTTKKLVKAKTITKSDNYIDVRYEDLYQAYLHHEKIYNLTGALFIGTATLCIIIIRGIIIFGNNITLDVLLLGCFVLIIPSIFFYASSQSKKMAMYAKRIPSDYMFQRKSATGNLDKSTRTELNRIYENLPNTSDDVLNTMQEAYDTNTTQEYEVNATIIESNSNYILCYFTHKNITQAVQLIDIPSGIEYKSGQKIKLYIQPYLDININKGLYLDIDINKGIYLCSLTPSNA